MLLLINIVCCSSSLTLPILPKAAQHIKSWYTNLIAFNDAMTGSVDKRGATFIFILARLLILLPTV